MSVTRTLGGKGRGTACKSELNRTKEASQRAAISLHWEDLGTARTSLTLCVVSLIVASCLNCAN